MRSPKDAEVKLLKSSVSTAAVYGTHPVASHLELGHPLFQVPAAALK